MYKLIDLSQSVNSEIGVYPGDSKFICTPLTSVSKDNYRISILSIGSHCGTHADAPAHFIENGKGMSELPLEHFVGKAFMINAKYNGEYLDTEYIKSQLENSDGAKILIIDTGWASKVGTPDYFVDVPRFDGDLSDALKEAGIITLCCDMPTVCDNFSNKSMHTKLLGKGIVIIEALINLDKITHSHFFFSAAPIKLDGCDGSPVRAYAIDE